MRKLVALFGLLTVLSVVQADIPPPQRADQAKEKEPPTEIKEGWYRLNGAVGDRPYAGMVVISHTREDIYAFRWVVAGQPDSVGFGVLGRDGRFTVAWQSDTNRGMMPGLTQYRVQPNGSITGAWRNPVGIQGNERLVWAFSLERDE